MSILSEIEASVPALHRYASSLVSSDRQDADDLVQDCLVRALSQVPQQEARRASGDGQEPILPWLFTILHNLSVSRWRALRRRGIAVDPEDANLQTPATQEWAPARRDLLRGFEGLSPEHRQVLLLVSVEGLEYREVAAVLGVPIGTVMSRLSRARDALRAAINGDERPALRRVK
jgi:RNA polymerase sigma-70 factor (ECF subfamily)